MLFMSVSHLRSLAFHLQEMIFFFSSCPLLSKAWFKKDMAKPRFFFLVLCPSIRCLLWPLQHCFQSKPATETYQTGHEPYLGEDEGWREMRTQCRPFRYQNKNKSFDFKCSSGCPSVCGSVYLCCLSQSWFHRQVAPDRAVPSPLLGWRSHQHVLPYFSQINRQLIKVLYFYAVCVCGDGERRRKRAWLKREERNNRAKICSGTIRDWIEHVSIKVRRCIVFGKAVEMPLHASGLCVRFASLQLCLFPENETQVQVGKNKSEQRISSWELHKMMTLEERSAKFAELML